MLCAAFAVAAFGMNAEVANTLYIIGEPAGGWSPSKGLEMTKTSDGVFEKDVVLTGKNSFGFVKELNNNGDWGALNGCRYTPPSAGTVPVEGENEMLYNGGATDYSWDLEAGSYHFTVNTNTMKFILSKTGDTPVVPDPEPQLGDLYFVGEVTDWAFLEEYKMQREGDVYTYSTGTIRGGLQFKLSDSSWSPAYTTLNIEMTVGETYEVTTGDGLGNMQLKEDVIDAVLTLDVKAMTLKIEGSSAAVEDIELESADAEYYNLQGVRVAAPESGLYIVRRAGKTSKILIH